MSNSSAQSTVLTKGGRIKTNPVAAQRACTPVQTLIEEEEHRNQRDEMAQSGGN